MTGRMQISMHWAQVPLSNGASCWFPAVMMRKIEIIISPSGNNSLLILSTLQMEIRLSSKVSLYTIYCILTETGFMLVDFPPTPPTPPPLRVCNSRQSTQLKHQVKLQRHIAKLCIFPTKAVHEPPPPTTRRLSINAAGRGEGFLVSKSIRGYYSV